MSRPCEANWRERERVGALLGTVNLLTRRSHRSGRIRCLFLIHYMEAWDSVADVIADGPGGGL